MTASKMTINGVEVDGHFGRITVDEKRLEFNSSRPSPIGVTSGTYVCDLETSDANAIGDFFEAIESMKPRDAVQPEAILHGKGNASTATFMTLGKRYFYGGRKARSAKRRMIAGIFGPTRVKLQPTGGHLIGFACPYPVQKAKE